MKESYIFKIVNKLLYLLLAGGLVILFTYDFIIKSAIVVDGFINYLIYRILVSILILLGMYIVFQLIKVFETIKKETPFIISNVVSLRKIAVCAVLIGIIFLISFIFTMSILRIGAGICFVTAGLCAYVFSQLFKSAIYIKEENDYTI